MHCKWAVVTALDRRRKRLRLFIARDTGRVQNAGIHAKEERTEVEVGRRQRQDSERGTHR